MKSLFIRITVHKVMTVIKERLIQEELLKGKNLDDSIVLAMGFADRSFLVWDSKVYSRDYMFCSGKQMRAELN